MMKKESVMELKLLVSIALLLAFASSVNALTISNVNVVNITDTTAIVTWQTDVPATGFVFYGTNKSILTSIGTQSTLVTQAVVPLIGLSPQTIYYFGINATDGSGNSVVHTNAGNYFAFTTTVPLFINVTGIPAYVNTNHVDVIGTTKPGAQISVFVNGVLQRFATSGGTFAFYNVPITQNAQNDVNVSASSAGFEVSQDFTVISDTTPPVLVITSPIPKSGDYVKTSSINIIGTVSEPSTITIKSSSQGGSLQAVYTHQGTSFNAQVNLSEGVNTIEVDAVDQAGNAASQSYDLNVDSIAPTISDISPTPGRPIFENFAKQATIRGKTDPGATVKMFINRTPCLPGQSGGFFGGCAPDYTTTADADGNFEFKRVDITKSITGFIGIVQVAPGAQSSQPTLGYTLDLHFEVTDKAGNVGLPPPVEYPVGTCFNTDQFWTVKINWQAPPILSPERLAAGTEEVSVVVEFNYTGIGREPKITGAQIVPECTSSDDWIRNDPKYNWSCRIIGRTPSTSIGNPAKTKWYFLFSTSKLPGADSWNNDKWKYFLSSMDSRMDFPFRVTYGYKHTIEGNETFSSGTSCFSLSYAVDNVRLNPKKIIPDELLNTLIKAANDTIAGIDYVQKKILQPLVDYTGYVCISSWAYNTLVKAVRIGKCAYSAAKGPDESPDRKNNKKDTTECDSCVTSVEADGYSKKDQSKYSNQCLAACFNGCSNSWDSEASSYKLFRASCDRLFAHKTPAGFTATLPSADIVNKIDQGKACGNADIVRGARLVRSTSACDDNSVTPKQKITPCYVWGGYQYKVVVGDTSCGPGLKKLVRIDKKITSLNAPPGKIEDDTLCANGEEASGYVVSRTVDCAALCKQYNYDSGSSKPGTEPAKPGICPTKPSPDGKTTQEGIGFGYTTDYKPSQANTQCCCYPVVGKPTLQNVYPLGSEPRSSDTYLDVSKKVGKESLEVAPATTQQQEYGTNKLGVSPVIGSLALGTSFTYSGSTPNDWNYRYSIIHYGGGVYNPDRYYSGRDQYACFGQNDWVSSTKVKLNPNTDFLNKFQCAAIGPLSAQLTQWKNIAGGLQRCLTQIKTVGNANSAMCKQLFTVYLCSSLVEALTWIKNKVFNLDCNADARPAESGLDYASVAALPLASVYEAVDQSVKQFNEEYDNAALQDFLGAGVGQVARKLCVGAFFGDWDLSAKGLVSAAYSTPFETLVASFAPPNKREFVTINPVSQQATYSYSGSWLISPGCDITSYTVQLSCVSQKEMAEGKADCSGIQCDCAELTSERVTTYYQGRPLRQNEQEEAGVQAKLITNVNRFDHLKFIFNVDPKVKENCFPQEHADGIYYIPLREAQNNFDPYCQLQPATGTFVCGLGQELFDKEGTAQISQVSLNNSAASVVNNIIYTDYGLNAKVSIDNFKGNAKCLVYEFRDRGGVSKLKDSQGKQVPELIYPSPVESDGDFPLSDSDFDLVLEANQVTKSDNIKDLVFNVVAPGPTSTQSNVRITVKDGNNDGKFSINDFKLGKDIMTSPDGTISITTGLTNEVQLRTQAMTLTITGTQDVGSNGAQATGILTVVPLSQANIEDQRTFRVYLTNIKTETFTGVQDCDLNNVVSYRSQEQSKTFPITLRKGKPAAGTQPGITPGGPEAPQISSPVYTVGGKTVISGATFTTADELTATVVVTPQGSNVMDKVYLDDSPHNANSWTSDELTKGTGNSWSNTFVLTDATPGDYDYRIKAVDKAGHVAFSSTLATFTINKKQ